MAIFRITEEDGETRDVIANWEPDGYIVATGNDGKVRLYDTENNLDDPPAESGQYINEDEDLREINLPDNVELIHGFTIDDEGETIEEVDDDYYEYIEDDIVLTEEDDSEEDGYEDEYFADEE